MGGGCFEKICTITSGNDEDGGERWVSAGGLVEFPVLTLAVGGAVCGGSAAGAYLHSLAVDASRGFATGVAGGGIWLRVRHFAEC